MPIIRLIYVKVEPDRLSEVWTEKCAPLMIKTLDRPILSRKCTPPDHQEIKKHSRELKKSRRSCGEKV